jgi:S1-C subfamily serine protease
MVVIRENKRKQITAVVEESESGQSVGKNLHDKLAGASFADITEDSPLYGRIEGVVVVDVEQGSPAWASGLRKGDIITSANRKKISNMSEFTQALKGSKSLLLNVQRGRGALFLFLQ